MIKKNHTREKVSGITTYDYRKKSRVKPATSAKNINPLDEISTPEEFQDFMFQKKILDEKIDVISSNLYKSIAASQGEAIEHMMKLHKASNCEEEDN